MGEFVFDIVDISNLIGNRFRCDDDDRNGSIGNHSLRLRLNLLEIEMNERRSTDAAELRFLFDLHRQVKETIFSPDVANELVDRDETRRDEKVYFVMKKERKKGFVHSH